MPLQEYVSLSSAAQILGISRQSTLKKVNSGRFPGAYQEGNRWKIPLAHVLAEKNSPKSLGRPQLRFCAGDRFDPMSAGAIALARQLLEESGWPDSEFDTLVIQLGTFWLNQAVVDPTIQGRLRTAVSLSFRNQAR